MEKYTVIKTQEQLYEYVNEHKRLWKNPTPENEEARELLDVLIEDWERKHVKPRTRMNPVEMLAYIMENHGLDATALSKILGVNKSTVSKILNYKKGMSKYVIRKLAETFKMQQEAFNREYALVTDKPKRSKTKLQKKKIAKKVKAVPQRKKKKVAV